MRLSTGLFTAYPQVSPGVTECFLHSSGAGARRDRAPRQAGGTARLLGSGSQRLLDGGSARLLDGGQVRPWVARRELAGFRPGRAPYAALRRDGRVIIARARPVIDARHSVGVVMQHRVV